MSDIVVKTFRGFEIKDAEKGEVEAKVSTLDVIDKDGDIIRRGAQGKSAKVAMSSWGHDAMFGSRPAGKGKLVEDGGVLKFAGKVFLSTNEGRETFEVLKEMGEDQEWSFGFRVLGSEVPSEAERKAGAVRILTKIDAFEVSPVLMGAGMNTQTTSLKGKGGSPPAPTEDDETIQAIAKQVVEQMEARRKAADDEAALVAAEAARIEAETKAATEAREQQEAKAAVDTAVVREFEKFQRTMRQVA